MPSRKSPVQTTIVRALVVFAAVIQLIAPAASEAPERAVAADAFAPRAADLRCDGPDGALFPVQYHRLRIKLQTASNGASFKLDDAVYVLSASQKAFSGSVLKHGLTMRELWVAPETAGQSVSVTAHFALNSGAAGSSLPAQIKQAGEGSTVLQVYKYEDRKYTLIQQESLAAAGSKSVNLDLSKLADKGLISAVVPRIADQKMIWAFYYPWYVDDWDTSILLDEPAIGYYSSANFHVMKSHIESASASGIDGFISSWWGPGDYTDTNLKSLLDIARDRSFKVMINFETLTTNAEGETVPLASATIQNWLSYAISRYKNHPAYMKVGGKPVIVLWASEAVSVATWEQIFAALRAKGKDAVYISMVSGSWPTLRSLDNAAGWHTYNILMVIQKAEQVPTLLAQVYARNKRAVRHYPLVLGTSAPRIWCATAQPGYDDHLIPGRTTPILKRRSGDLYRETLDAAETSDPDWIFITSWNEWWEHTYIEPSKKYGNLYLNITRDFAEDWK
jgi:hypothetical protein